MSDTFASGGSQIVNARTYKRLLTPTWVYHDSEIRTVLLRAFPKLATDEKQREAAARWGAVIHLYYKMRYTSSQVAQELGTSTLKIKNVLRSISRVSKGLRANGSGRRGGVRTGRPKLRASKSSE